jgi:hypothetical protein
MCVTNINTDETKLYMLLNCFEMLQMVISLLKDSTKNKDTEN